MKEELELAYSAKLEQAQREAQFQIQAHYQQEYDRKILEVQKQAMAGLNLGGLDPQKPAVAAFQRRSRMEALGPYAKDIKDPKDVTAPSTMQNLLEQSHGATPEEPPEPPPRNPDEE